MKKIILTLTAVAVLILTACNDKKAASTSNETGAATDTTQTEAGQTEEKTAGNATLDGISQLVGWQSTLLNIKKNTDEIVLSSKEGSWQLRLKPQEDGTYKEISGKRDQQGQSCTYVVRKVGSVTTLTAYYDNKIEFAVISCDDLKAYRNRGYRRMLTSKFEPTEDGIITITDDTIKGSILPDINEMTYFFIEDGEGDITDKIRLSPGRWHLAFSPADKGVNLHFCLMKPDTGDLEVQYDKENTIYLHYAKDPGWAWLSTDVLDSDFIVFNFEKPYWKLMLSKLKDKKERNDVEQWNLQLLEQLIAHQDAFTGLESSDN